MSRVERVWCRSAPWAAFTRRVVLPWALGDTHLGGEVLEIGSGSGSDAAELVRRLPSVRVTATDADPAMLAAAQRRLGRIRSRASIVNGDATRLPFGDGRFDFVVSFLMLHHVITWEDALGEAVRVLRPGGVLVGYDLMRSAPAELLHRLDRSPHRLFSADELRSRLVTLGLTGVVVVGGLGGLVARFKAGKPAAVPHPGRLLVASGTDPAAPVELRPGRAVGPGTMLNGWRDLPAAATTPPSRRSPTSPSRSASHRGTRFSALATGGHPPPGRPSPARRPCRAAGSPG